MDSEDFRPLPCSSLSVSMFGLLRITSLTVACLGGLTAFGHAQSYSAAPISVDIAQDESSAEPLLIAAFQPQADVQPQFLGQGGQGAVVTRAGLPTPSIILGLIEAGQEAAFGITRLLPETVAQIGFPYNDLDRRVALRDSDPDIFRQLVEEGHVDPPANVLNAALQTELQRMNCYRSGIDGAWGPGSRRSVGSYFNERDDDVSWPDQEPSNELFRTIIVVPDVACPTPQAAPARTTSAPARATPRATTTTTRRATAPAPAAPRPKPAAPAAKPKPKIKLGGGTGVFR